jgi:hypothetical protein
VLAKEKKLGKEIATRSKSRNGRTGYFVTAKMLRDEFPELLIPTAEGVARDVKIRMDAMVADLDQKVQETVSGHLDSCLTQNRDLKIEVSRLRDYTERNIRSLSAQIEGLCERLKNR